MAYRLRPARPFTAEFRSVAQNQLLKAVHLLEKQTDGPHEAVHDARKRFKRVRALYRLIQPDAKEFRRRENARIREISRSLSVVRDATALVETVDYLAGHAKSPDEFAALTLASTSLTRRRDRIASEEHDLPAKIGAAIAACHQAIAAVDELSLDNSPRRTAKRVRAAWRNQRLRAHAALLACDAHGEAEAYHELRKSGQTYWMHLSLLGDIWPSAMLAKQHEAKALVDLLGHEHDLSVLTHVVNENPELFGGSDTLARVLGAIIGRQQILREEAVEKAKAVFADDADTESDVIALLWERAATRPKKKKRFKSSGPHAGNGKESALQEPV